MMFKAAIDNCLDKRIQMLRTDKGLKCLRNEFNNHLEMARSILLQSDLPQTFRVEGINCAAHIYSRCPSTSFTTK